MLRETNLQPSNLSREQCLVNKHLAQGAKESLYGTTTKSFVAVLETEPKIELDPIRSVMWKKDFRNTRDGAHDFALLQYCAYAMQKRLQ